MKRLITLAATVCLPLFGGEIADTPRIATLADHLQGKRKPRL